MILNWHSMTYEICIIILVAANIIQALHHQKTLSKHAEEQLHLKAQVLYYKDHIHDLVRQTKRIAVSFFYYWHNQPGTNTDQGFDEWWDNRYAEPDHKKAQNQ